MISPAERLVIQCGLDLMTIWGDAAERTAATELLAHLDDKIPCAECLGRNERPDNWCDCRTDETCDGPCRQRAHQPSDHE